jgi:hypothetical protein
VFARGFFIPVSPVWQKRLFAGDLACHDYGGLGVLTKRLVLLIPSGALPLFRCANSKILIVA